MRANRPEQRAFPPCNSGRRAFRPSPPRTARRFPLCHPGRRASAEPGSSLPGRCRAARAVLGPGSEAGVTIEGCRAAYALLPQRTARLPPLSPRTAQLSPPFVTPDEAKRRSGVQPVGALPGRKGGAGPRLGGRGDNSGRPGRFPSPPRTVRFPPLPPTDGAPFPPLSPTDGAPFPPFVTPDEAKRRSGVQPAGAPFPPPRRNREIEAGRKPQAGVFWARRDTARCRTRS